MDTLVPAHFPRPLDRGDGLECGNWQRVARQRDGAFYWQLFQDAAASEVYLETFLAESWLEHLRQHERVTQADRLLQDEISRCLADTSQPAVTHYLAVTGTGEP